MTERPVAECSRLVQRQLGKRGCWEWTMHQPILRMYGELTTCT